MLENSYFGKPNFGNMPKFSVPGLQFPIPGLNPEEKRPGSQDKNITNYECGPIFSGSESSVS
jgi:hypothetical protein